MAISVDVSQKKKILLWFILIFAAAAGTVFFVYNFAEQSILIVENQPAGEYVVIKQAFSRQGGFVVVRLPDKAGKPGAMAAVPRYLFPSIRYRDLKLTVFGPEQNPELQKAPSSGDDLFAALYEDSDGNKGFSAAVDLPMKNPFGKLIIKKFRVE